LVVAVKNNLFLTVEFVEVIRPTQGSLSPPGICGIESRQLDKGAMPIPESTSAEAFERYVGGKCIVACRGEAWHDIKAWIIAPPRSVEMVSLPAVSEPFLAWSVSGEAEFQEREGNQPWVTHRIRKGSFFLTSGGAPYDCRWKAVGNEPFQSMAAAILSRLTKAARKTVFNISTSATASATSVTHSATGYPATRWRVLAGSLAMPSATRRQMAICSRTDRFPKPSLCRFIFSGGVGG
jgi:hypothetical protein